MINLDKRIICFMMIIINNRISFIWSSCLGTSNSGKHHGLPCFIFVFYICKSKSILPGKKTRYIRLSIFLFGSAGRFLKVIIHGHWEIIVVFVLGLLRNCLYFSISQLRRCILCLTNYVGATSIGAKLYFIRFIKFFVRRPMTYLLFLNLLIIQIWISSLISWSIFFEFLFDR